MSKSFFYCSFLIIILSTITFTQTDIITILHVNDTHSCLSPLGPRNSSLEGTQGGMSRAATVIGLTRMTEANVLLLHSGDSFTGDLFFNSFFGVAEFQMMNSLALDAMAVGNHEFDLTPTILDASLRNSFPPGSGFPLLSANLILDDPAVEPLKDYIFPYVIKQRGYIKAGIFGLTTPETMVFSQPVPAAIDTNIAQITLAMIDTLTSQGCNLIICLSHLGIYYDQQLATNIPGIDVILSGHDHLATETPIEITNPFGETTYIVQADAFYKYIGKMKLSVTGNDVQLLSYELIHLDETIPEEPTVKAQVDELINEIEYILGPVYSQQIGYATAFFEEVANNLTANGSHDTPIGNLVTDAYRWKTGTEIGITVGGSTAHPIYEGPLVAADAFRVVGYGMNDVNFLGFRLIKFQLSGADIIAGLEFGVSMAEYSDELFPQVSGMSYSYNLSNPVGSRIVYAEVGGSVINSVQTYSVTANEFLVFALSDPELIGTQINIINPYLYEDSTEFQVLSEYIINKQTISPEYRNNIIADVKIIEDDNSPVRFSLEQNYPNPFNPSTTIKYSIPDNSFVTLKVYDIIGNELVTLVNKERSPGSYEVSFNASEYSSGIYIYALRTDTFTQTKKMMLIK